MVTGIPFNCKEFRKIRNARTQYTAQMTNTTSNTDLNKVQAQYKVVTNFI